MSRTVRIGIDARELAGEPTGVGRYLGELLTRWISRADATDREFVLYAPEAVAAEFQSEHVRHRVVGEGAGRGTWWEQTHLRRAVSTDDLDVFFAPAYTAPLGLRVPLAITIHDVSFAAHPEWFRPREGLRRRWLTRKGAHRAAVVFTDSEFSRTEIERHFTVPTSRIVVISPGVTDRAYAAPVTAPSQPYVLYVGTLFNRRRLPDLIEAFAIATRDLDHVRLVIVGGDRTWPPQDLSAVARQHGVLNRVELRRYAPDSELTPLYARASGFAFLSEYEGFGLTPLEAMSAGVPAIVLDTPVAREIYGDAATFVARGDLDGTAAAIRRLILDPSSAAPLRAAAIRILTRYSWDTAADQTLTHLLRIVRR